MVDWDADKEEKEFEKAIEAVLYRFPRHTGAIWLMWSFYDEKGQPDKAVKWLDQRVEILRKTEDDSSERVADYIEFIAACYMLDLGQQDEGRLRLQKIVLETQPGNLEALREITRIGVGAFPEAIAQDLYKKAYLQPPGRMTARRWQMKHLVKTSYLSIVTKIRMILCRGHATHACFYFVIVSRRL